MCGLAAKMFVVGQKSGTLEFGGRPTNDLLVFEQFKGSPWMGADIDQRICSEGIYPLMKTVNNRFSFADHGYWRGAWD